MADITLAIWLEDILYTSLYINIPDNSIVKNMNSFKHITYELVNTLKINGIYAVNGL